MSATDNPVLVKEMRTRMRGARAYWLIFGHVMLLSVILLISYLTWLQIRAYAGGYPMAGGAPLGRRLFQAMFTAQAVMITLITPALTAGMLTLEREQRTFELLVLTVLRPREIINGKLLSAFGFVLLLLTASLPLAGICFMLGGVAPQEVAVVYLLLALSSLVYGSVGILFSSMLRSTAMSTAATYMAVLFLAGATGMLAAGGKEMIFASVSPIAAVWFALDAAPFYRWHLATWMPAMVLILGSAILIVVGAIHRLEEGVTDRSSLLRWLALLMFVVVVVAGTANAFGRLPTSTSVSEVRSVGGGAAGMLLSILSLLVLVFCTGDAHDLVGIRKPRHEILLPGILGRLARARVFTGGYASAPLYLLLLFVAGAAAIGAGPILTGHKVWPLTLDTTAASLLVVFTPLLCAVAMARLYSVMTGSRSTAAALTFFTLTAMVLLPLLNYLSWDSSLHPRHQIAWETLYLNPGIAFMALSGSPTDWARSVPALWAGQGASWIVTVVLYLGLAAALELAAQSLSARRPFLRVKRET